MASPIPVASFGNNSDVAQGVRAKLLPEYDGSSLLRFPELWAPSNTSFLVVHIALSLEAALAELPVVSSGELETAPSSGLGSNAGAPVAERKAPKAIIFGAGIPEEDVARVIEAVNAKAPGVKPIQVTKEDVQGAGADKPNPEIIVKILKDKLAGI